MIKLLLAILVVEHAVTDIQKGQGLMDRSSLPENQGMLFHYPQEQVVTLWMYRCHFPLSVAFLDRSFRILSIKEMKAYPHISNPEFFKKHAISSEVPCAYALEVNPGWFQKNRFKVGDKLKVQ